MKNPVYVSFGLMLGAGMGIIMGAALDNIPIGISFGAGLGLMLGITLNMIKSGNDKE